MEQPESFGRLGNNKSIFLFYADFKWVRKTQSRELNAMVIISLSLDSQANNQLQSKFDLILRFTSLDNLNKTLMQFEFLCQYAQ